MSNSHWPTRVTITVTAQDASDGRRGNPYACPVALSLNRRCRGECWNAHTVTAEVQDETARGSYRYSDRLKDAVYVFDAGHPFPPGTYRMTREP